MLEVVFIYSIPVLLFMCGCFAYNYAIILNISKDFQYSCRNKIFLSTNNTIRKNFQNAPKYVFLMLSDWFIKLHFALSPLSNSQFVGFVFVVSSVFMSFSVALLGVANKDGAIIGFYSVMAVLMTFAIASWKNFGFFVSISPITVIHKKGGYEIYTLMFKNEKQFIVKLDRIWIENTIGNIKFRIPISVSKESSFLSPLSVVNIESETSFYTWKNIIVEIPPSFLSSASVMISDGTYVYNCSLHSMSFWVAEDYIFNGNDACCDLLPNRKKYNGVIYGIGILYAVDCLVDNQHKIGFITEEGLFYCDEIEYMRHFLRPSTNSNFDMNCMKLEDIEHSICNEYPEIKAILVTRINRNTPKQSITPEEIAERIKRENA